MLDLILKESDNEYCVQRVLEDMEKIVKITGTVSLTSAVQSIVGRLCASILPKNMNKLKWKDGYKYIFISGTVISITKSLYEFIDQTLWMQIFKFLERVAACINKESKQKQEEEQIQFNSIIKKLPLEYTSKDTSNNRKRLPSEPTGVSKALMLTEFPEDNKERISLGSMGNEVSNENGSAVSEARTEVKSYKGFELNPQLVDTKGKLQDEIENVRQSLNSLFSYTVKFDVIPIDNK